MIHSLSKFKRFALLQYGNKTVTCRCNAFTLFRPLTIGKMQRFITGIYLVNLLAYFLCI